MKIDKVINDFHKRVDKDVKTIVKETAFKIYREITAKTAVGNPDIWKGFKPVGYVGGRLRASLTISQGTPDLSIAPKGSVNVPVPKLGKLKDDPTIYITNNLPYAERVLNDGWSAQTPENMAENAVRKAFLGLKAGKFEL